MDISIIKQDMDRLLDKDFVTALFNERLVNFYPKFKKIAGLDINTYKKHTGKTSMILVLEYVVTYVDSSSQSQKINLFASAHSDGSRARAFDAQNYLYQHGFDQGSFLVARPLFYLAEQYAFFYQAALGRTLRKMLRQDANIEVGKFLEQSAQWVKKLHQCPIEAQHNFKHFNVRQMSPQPAKFLADLSAVYPELGSRLQGIYDRLCLLQEKNEQFYQPTLVHGDYHPENIIFKSSEPEKIKVIDLVDLALGDPMIDLGSFVQQFDFMFFQILNREKINQLKISFLENYFSTSFQDIDINYINRLNFFQAWVVIRTTLLLFYAKSARHPLDKLVEETGRYLDLAENSQRQINLY